MYESYKDQGLVFIGVHCDDWNEAKKVAIEKKIKYPITNDVNDKTSDAYKVMWFPTIVVIDKKGVVRSVEPDDLEAAIQGLLKES